MIIECIKCDKKFDVDSNLIPSEGRSIQCGSCNHVWFFKKIKNNEIKVKKSDSIQDKSKLIKKNIIKSSENVDKSLKKKYWIRIN